MPTESSECWRSLRLSHCQQHTPSGGGLLRGVALQHGVRVDRDYLFQRHSASSVRHRHFGEAIIRTLSSSPNSIRIHSPRSDAMALRRAVNVAGCQSRWAPTSRPKLTSSLSSLLLRPRGTQPYTNAPARALHFHPPTPAPRHPCRPALYIHGSHIARLQ